MIFCKIRRNLMKFDLKIPKYAEIPAWADEKEIIDFLYNSLMRRKEKDFAMIYILDKLIARIETLETCIDDLVIGEK